MDIRAFLNPWRAVRQLRTENGRLATLKPTSRVYLIATGETHEGRETYTRHDEPVPMADQEVLWAYAEARKETK